MKITKSYMFCNNCGNRFVYRGSRVCPSCRSHDTEWDDELDQNDSELGEEDLYDND